MHTSEIFSRHMGICILRLQNGFDYSHYGSLTKIFESMEEKNHNAFFNRSFTSVELGKSFQESLDKCTDDRKTFSSSSAELQGEGSIHVLSLSKHLSEAKMSIAVTFLAIKSVFTILITINIFFFVFCLFFLSLFMIIF